VLTRHPRAIAVAVVAAAALAVPPAHASPTAWPGCGYDTLSAEVVVAGHHAGDRTRYFGVVYAAMVLSDPDSPATPVSGTVRCFVRINGVETRSTAPVHGTGLVVLAEPVSFTATYYDVVQLCEEVTFDGGPARTECYEDTYTQIPPQELWDFLDAVAGGTLTPIVVPVACSVTGDRPEYHELLGAWVGYTGWVYGFTC
jgi:hypothetical protein